MEIEFKCMFEGCGFKSMVNWPLEKDSEWKPTNILENQMRGISPLTEHHVKTRINLTEYQGFGTGHSNYRATLVTEKEIEVTVSGMIVVVDKDFFKNLRLS